MIELKIKKKYFDAILELKKPFELRHKPIPKGTIVKLIEISDNINDIRSLDAASGFRHYIWVKFKKEDIEKSKKLNVSLDIIAKIREADGQKEYADFLRTNIHETGRYIIFESGRCIPLEKTQSWCYNAEDFENSGHYAYWSFESERGPKWNEFECSYIDVFCDNPHSIDYEWFDKFCWDYINEKQTYLIEIAKILEVK